MAQMFICPYVSIKETSEQSAFGVNLRLTEQFLKKKEKKKKTACGSSLHVTYTEHKWVDLSQQFPFLEMNVLTFSSLWQYSQTFFQKDTNKNIMNIQMVKIKHSI